MYHKLKIRSTDKTFVPRLKHLICIYMSQLFDILFILPRKMYEITYYNKIQRHPLLGKKKYFKFFLNIALIVFVFYFLFSKFIAKTPDEETLFISPLANVIQKTVSIFNSRENSKQLESIVLENLKEDKDKFGIVISNLATGERYYLNEDKAFETASLYKLWVMSVVFNQIQNGKIKDTEVLSKDVEALNKTFNIGSDSAELTEGTVIWPVRTALEKMIIISDNYSAYLLTQRVGIKTVSDFLLDNGFLKSQMGTLETNPKTTASDIALFFKKLYEGQLADETYTSKMFELLKNQQLNGKLPKLLAKDVTVAHKTGELGGLTHDGGVVYTDKGDYIIVIMSETKTPLDANENIANISKAVYVYFTR